LNAITPGNVLCKYVDDTYLIIPSVNVNSRLEELKNIESWAEQNHLAVNHSKSLEEMSLTALLFLTYFIQMRDVHNLNTKLPL